MSVCAVPNNIPNHLKTEVHAAKEKKEHAPLMS
jgi:hypothetical protein